MTQQIQTGGTDGQTWRRLNRIAIVIFENLPAKQFLKFIFVVCNVWFHAWVISQVP